MLNKGNNMACVYKIINMNHRLINNFEYVFFFLYENKKKK